MTSTAIKTYLVGVIERALAHYEVEAENAGTAAENWQDGDFIGRDDEALDTEGPSSVHERQPDGTFLKLPRSQWDAAPEIVRFDDYEIHGVSEFDDDGRKFCEQVDDDEAQFWSLYGHIAGQGVECIGDYKTHEHAEEVYARITGRRYGSQC
jgi:hypothetical protein